MNASALLTGMKDYSPELLASHVLPRLPLILTWLLVLALGVQAAAIVRDLIPQRQAPQTISAPPPSVAAPARAPLDVASIQNAQLFGMASAEAPQGDAANAPQTQLSLVLVGALAAADPQKGLGIIGESAAAARVYAVGDSLPGGAQLHEVYPEYVILNRNGQLEKLSLPRQFNTAALATAPATPSPGAVVANRVRQMSQDPGSIAEVMRPQAVFSNGQQRGYRVYPGRNRQSFAQLGLQPGDLVLSINDTPLDDPQRGMEIFNTIGSASQVRVTIERRGQQQSLVLNMSQLANQASGLAPNNGAREAPANNAVPVEQMPQMPPNPEQ